MKITTLERNIRDISASVVRSINVINSRPDAKEYEKEEAWQIVRDNNKLIESLKKQLRLEKLKKLSLDAKKIYHKKKSN